MAIRNFLPEDWSGTLPSARPLSVIVVDPGSFSLGYDYPLCNALARQGCQVTLANSTFPYAEWDHRAEFSTWTQFYRCTHIAARYCSRGTLWKAAKAAEHVIDMARLVSFAISAEPDVIHFQWLPLPLVDSYYMSVLERVAPLILTVHNTSFTLGRSGASSIQYKGFESSLRHFSAAVVHCAYGKTQILRQEWFREEQVECIPMGAYRHYENIGDCEPPKTAGENVLVFMGSIKPYKGVDVLVRALALLRQALLKNTRLIVMGTPDKHIGEIRKLAYECGVDSRITWRLGFVREEELATNLRLADVVVLPYREADQSAALLTAVGMCKPVIATRVGGIPEVIEDGEHGYLVEPGDATELADAIARLLSHPATRDRMEQAVRRLRNDFTWEQTAAQTCQLYSRLAGRPEVMKAVA